MDKLKRIFRKKLKLSTIKRSLSEPQINESVIVENSIKREAVSLDFGLEYIQEFPTDYSIPDSGYCEIINVLSSTSVSLCILNKQFTAHICNTIPLQCYDLKERNVSKRGKAIFAKLMLTRLVHKMRKENKSFYYNINVQDQNTIYIELLLEKHNVGQWLCSKKYVCLLTENLEEFEFSYEEF